MQSVMTTTSADGDNFEVDAGMDAYETTLACLNIIAVASQVNKITFSLVQKPFLFLFRFY